MMGWWVGGGGLSVCVASGRIFFSSICKLPIKRMHHDRNQDRDYTKKKKTLAPAPFVVACCTARPVIVLQVLLRYSGIVG